MNRSEFLIKKLLSLLIFVQLFALQLEAQPGLVKPEKMDEATFARFTDIVKYNIPDSLIFYPSGKNAQPYMKFNFIYNNRHNPVVEDEYKMYGKGYRLTQRTIKNYNPVTTLLRQTDLRIIDKAYKDSVSTRTEYMLIYDSIGNLVLRYTVDTMDNNFARLTGDSMVYNYDRNGVPLFEKMYFFGFVGSNWILDKECKVEGMGSDGNPKLITFSFNNTDNEITPIKQYRYITWAKHCNNLEDIDTLAKEYTVADFNNGKWDDNYKKVNSFNPSGKVDSSIAYTFKNGSPQPRMKDIYTYLGNLGFQSKLHYEYVGEQWKLITGTRYTLGFVEDGNNRYYLNVKAEVYEIPPGENSGNWKEQMNIVIN